MIPKKIFFFWGNEKMSWMRYMTLYSFVKFNPEWKVSLYRCEPNEHNTKPWRESNQQDFFVFDGEDYYDRVNDLNIDVIDWDLDKDSLKKISPSQKSNFFKWKMLSERGGIYSDTDILYLRPIDEYYKKIKDCNVAICYRHNPYFSIGLLASSMYNRFFRDVYHNTRQTFNSIVYQNAGAVSLYCWLFSLVGVKVDPINDMDRFWNKVFSTNFWEILEKHYPEMCFYNNDMSLVYHWNSSDIHKIFYERETQISNSCIGIHWYAGDPISQKFNCLLTERNHKAFDNTFTYFANEVLK